MQDKVPVDLTGVPKTLLLPLIARAKLSEQGKSLVHDQAAVDIVKRLDFDFDKLIKDFGPQMLHIWSVRAFKFDAVIKTFLAKHPKAVVVNIGAGLETEFARIDNGQCTWVDLDLPEVIVLRNKLITPHARTIQIAKSLLDTTWINDLPNTDNGVLLLMAGISMYFSEAELKSLFVSLADKLPGAELFFEVLSPTSIKHANRKMRKANMRNAPMKWGAKHITDVTKWSEKITAIYEEPFFKCPKPGFSLITKFWMKISDLRRDSMIFHIKFK